MLLAALLPSLLGGCIRDTPRGPDLGACAKPPKGVYSFGDVGIGACLSGPADLRFFEQDGGTFLGVTNADPYRLFRSGSVLVIDWEDVVDRIEAGDENMVMDELQTYALEMTDDDDGDGVGTNPFLGGFGYLPASQTAIVTSRLTEGAPLRSGRDEVYLLDLSVMELPGRQIEQLGQLILEDDPFPVLVEPNGDRVFVGNLTDHSVSVLTTDVEAPPHPDLPLAVVDVATGADITEATLADLDASGTIAALSELAVEDSEEVFEDTWTVTFVDGTVRAWIPTPIEPDSETAGVVRFSTGGAEPYVASPFGIETGLGQVEQPFLELDASGLPTMLFSRPDGTVRRAYGSLLAGDWALESEPVLSGELHAAPSAVPLVGSSAIYTDVRAGVGAAASIALATSTDGLIYDDEGLVLEPPPGFSYEQPFAALDPLSGRYRMWLSVRRGARWEIALAESEDGRSWSDPQTVLSAPGLDAAAPTVALQEGRYGMWLALGDGTRWDHALATSTDGRTWSSPEVFAESELPFDVSAPPRAGVLVDRVGGWRVEGVDAGVVPSLLTAGSVESVLLFGYRLAVASGHEVDNNVVGQLRADRALVPGSVIELDGRRVLYATSTGSGLRDRIVALEQPLDGSEDWSLLVDPEDTDAMLGIGPAEQASNPVVVADGASYVLFLTVSGPDGIRIRRATSPDGLAWSALERESVLADDPDVNFDSVARYPHALETLEDGSVRLWYTGDDGSRTRIGSATAPSAGGVFSREPGATSEWRLGTGLPGGFDDTAVADPLPVTLADGVHLYFAGFDGSAWHLGHARINADGSIERRLDPVTALSAPSLSAAPRSFSAAGTRSPVLLGASDDTIELLYSGFDGFTDRLGRATSPTVSPDAIYAAQRFPTADDRFTFVTERGGSGAQVIELAQSTAEFGTTAFGMSGLAHDEAAGFLYVTTKLEDQVYVVDVRDDSNGSFSDTNYLDLEALVRIETGSASAGFRDAVLSPTRSLMYLTQRQPDGLVIVNTASIPDDDVKDTLESNAVAVLPFPDFDEDEGVLTAATIGGAGMAISADEKYLLITHFRQNALSVIDLEQGAWGAEVAWIPNLGENPHVVRISPDGRYAAVANYLGDVVDNVVSSTIAIVDVDPDSDTFLQAVAWLGNH